MARTDEAVACLDAVVRGSLLLATMFLPSASMAAVAGCAVCDASVQHYTTQQGLSHNAIVAMTQDVDRFVWLGTRDGLDRLDGTRVTRFETVGGYSLRGDKITTLATDPGGGLWIGLRDAVLHHDTGGQVRPFALDAPGRRDELTLLRAVKDGVWVGTTGGLFLLSRNFNTPPARRSAFEGEHILGMEVRNDTWQVISRKEGCWLRTLGRAGEPDSDPAPAPCWRAWVYSDKEMLGQSALPWTPGDALREPDDRLAGAAKVLPWHGGIVIAGLAGSYWRSPSGALHALWLGREGAVGRSPDGESLDAMIDADGALWLATFGGTHRFDPNALAFNGLDRGRIDRKLANRAVSDIVQFNGHWWIGTFGHGMIGGSEQGADPRIFQGDTPSALWSEVCGDYVWDLRPWQGSLLVNARCALDEALLLRKVEGSEQTASTRSSFVDAAGGLWFASGEGLFEFREGGLRQRLPGAFETMAEAPDGNLWLAPAILADGPADDALIVMSVRDGTSRRISLPGSLVVHDLLAVNESLWAATTDGLLRIDPESGSQQLLRPDQPEAGRVFYSLLDDGQGALWIGSNRGLLRFDPHAGKDRQFRHYDQRDGLHIQEFNRRSHARDDDGTLLFGGIGGVVRFDPQRALGRVPSPTPRVIAASVWNHGGERQITLRPGQDMELAADDLAIVLEFAAPGFRRAHHVGFRYRLEPADRDWVMDAGARSARYPRLEPATYLFRVQAGSEETGWQEATRPLRLVFHPAWHQSWWFRVPAFLALCVLAWLLYRWRVHHLIELERLRTRIAADLHDELGSELAAIGMSTAMLASRGGMPERERERLASVAASAQRVAEAMRDIVWYVNPDKDRIRALGERLHALARRVLGDAVALELSDGFADLDAELPMMARRALHLICREALMNIAQHAGAKTVKMTLDRSGDALTLLIEDDGSGFDATRIRDINGLANMRRRAASIGAELDIQSRPGAGTRIVLRWPHDRRRFATA